MPDDDPPIVDNFNRPDENPLSDGGAWTIRNNPPKVVSNQLACTSLSHCEAWRNNVFFGLDQDASITIATKPGYVRLFVRLQTPTVFEGYALRYQNNSGTDQVVFERIVNGNASSIVTPINQEFLPGDKLRVRAIGSTIESWRRDNSGTWSKLGEVTDSTYVGVGATRLAECVASGIRPRRGVGDSCLRARRPPAGGNAGQRPAPPRILSLSRRPRQGNRYAV